MTIEIAAYIGLLLTLIGVAMAVLRLVLGPTSADRIVALDLLTIQLVAIAALLAAVNDEPSYVDLSVALALVAFLSTVAFARYVERRPRVLRHSEEGPGLPSRRGSDS